MPDHTDEVPPLPLDPFRSDSEVWARSVGADGAASLGPGKVVVTSKSLVSQVFRDAAANYSVCGYASRTRVTIGEIYLNLDRGAEYDRHSQIANAAIGRVSAEEGFSVALAETRRVLGCFEDIEDIQLVSDRVLIGLCRHWFGIPDGARVKPGGLSDIGLPPPLCGRDAVFPSAYIFNPSPAPDIERLARSVGPILRNATCNLVTDRRPGGRWPEGAISQAIFEAFPQDDDLASRTIIGAIMGMVPTVDGNLTRAIKRWRSDTTFEGLQQALGNSSESDPFRRAMSVLEKPLKHAMQASPVPEAVWRTAIRAHDLGETTPVRVEPGDRVFLSIASATREDLTNGITDVFPIFGGDRTGGSSGTHACPGYKMAMGILLGIANGVLEPTMPSGP